MSSNNILKRIAKTGKIALKHPQQREESRHMYEKFAPPVKNNHKTGLSAWKFSIFWNNYSDINRSILLHPHKN